MAFPVPGEDRILLYSPPPTYPGVQYSVFPGTISVINFDKAIHRFQPLGLVILHKTKQDPDNSHDNHKNIYRSNGCTFAPDHPACTRE